jgi:hypothetical protein
VIGLIVAECIALGTAVVLFLGALTAGEVENKP